MNSSEDYKVVYGVPWIEIDFGSRPEGWELFLHKEECVKSTLKASKDGSYNDGGYYGPVRPLMYYEIPIDSIPYNLKNFLLILETNRKDKEEQQKPIPEDLNEISVFTDDKWHPKFKDSGNYIR